MVVPFLWTSRSDKSINSDLYGQRHFFVATAAVLQYSSIQRLADTTLNITSIAPGSADDAASGMVSIREENHQVQFSFEHVLGI